MITLTGQNNFFERITHATQLMRKGKYSTLTAEIQRQLDSESLAFGLQRNLDIPFHPPKAKINISVRPLEPDDIKTLLKKTSDDPVELRGISDQLSVINANIPDCYVAVTGDNTPCYMQWLIGADYNDRISGHFRGLFPPLTQPEALLEGAYTPPAFRGMGIMPAAMAMIASRAYRINAHLVNTFVDINNIPSLKGCHRAGFAPYVLRRDKWSMFRRTITFEPVPASMLESYNQHTAAKLVKNTHPQVKAVS